MGKKTKKAISVFALSIISSSVAAQTWAVGLKQVGVTLGWFMMIIMGIRWIMADSANERSDAKKGMLYIVVGLLIISMLCNLLCIYCDAAIKAGVMEDICVNMTDDYGCEFDTCGQLGCDAHGVALYPTCNGICPSGQNCVVHPLGNPTCTCV